MSDRAVKPLGRKAYGSIGHLPNSRMGPSDHHVHEGQARICTEKARKGDTVIVQEKLDGSCVSVAKIDGEIVPLIRAGYRAIDGNRPFQHQFHEWAMERTHQFGDLLADGERVVGEWLALAHGTRYSQLPEPFVAFDIMARSDRALAHVVRDRCNSAAVPTAHTLYEIDGAVPLQAALDVLRHDGFYGAHPDDGPEGVVYRVEREGRVDFLAKWVNPAKVDGKYLPELSGQPELWNWQPIGATR